MLAHYLIRRTLPRLIQRKCAVRVGPAKTGGEQPVLQLDHQLLDLVEQVLLPLKLVLDCEIQPMLGTSYTQQTELISQSRDDFCVVSNECRDVR